MVMPNRRIRLIYQPRVWDDPLSIKRSEPVSNGSDHVVMVVSDRDLTPGVRDKLCCDNLRNMLIASLAVSHVGVEQPLLFCRILFLDEASPARLKRLSIRGNHPCAAGHHTRAAVVDEIIQPGEGRPCPYRYREERVAPAIGYLNPAAVIKPEYGQAGELFLAAASRQNAKPHASR